MSLAKRQAFTLIKKAYEKINRKPVTTPSTLRLIVPLTANRTSFTFPILEGDSNLTHPNQILLNRADAFTATQMGVFIGGLENTRTLTGFELGVLAPANLGDELLISDVLTLETVTDLKPNRLFENGLLDIAVNNVKYLQNFDLLSTNKSSSLGVDSAVNNSLNIIGNTNGNFGERDGFVDLVPTLQFSGTSKIDITLNTPAAPYIGAAQLYVEIIFRGFLSLGASNLNK
jgi:hypothetical protein